MVRNVPSARCAAKGISEVPGEREGGAALRKGSVWELLEESGDAGGRLQDVDGVKVATAKASASVRVRTVPIVSIRGGIALIVADPAETASLPYT